MHSISVMNYTAGGTCDCNHMHGAAQAVLEHVLHELSSRHYNQAPVFLAWPRARRSRNVDRICLAAMPVGLLHVGSVVSSSL